ncbi:ATP/GTP-binding protein [Streptomyces sp. NPDC057717]|uniref:ATP/GTP-binding protein n=1 Tax=Streptomyces sp. NPDC057717 TaxID=3346224 RepID=UPI0036B9617F
MAVFFVGLVAQFVKPVGDALEGKAYLGGALLSLVGYVLYAEVQKLNAAHEGQRGATEGLHTEVQRLHSEVQRLSSMLRPQGGESVTPRNLEGYFADALDGEDETHIAALGFTGETVVVPLRLLLQGLARDPRRLVRIRILVPDFTRPIDVPGALTGDGKAVDSPGFRQKLLDQVTEYRDSLEGLSDRLKDRDRGEVLVEFRVMHMSPSLKLYFINDDQAFEGIYDKIELRRDRNSSEASASGEGSDDVRLLDLIGHDSLLTRWHRDDGPQARTMIQRRKELFDTYWAAARPLPGITGRPVPPQGAGRRA